MNPSLAEAADVEKTVAVGCSLVRAALGAQTPVCYEVRVDHLSGETLL